MQDEPKSTSLLSGTVRLVLVSAWNDSGGAFLARLLDGHPQLRGWPFELQLGTAGYTDAVSAAIRDKYRWPRLDVTADRTALFDAFLDDELKPVLRDLAPPQFAGYRPGVDLSAWRDEFVRMDLPGPPSRRAIVAAYIDSYFRLSGEASAAEILVGHCPSIILDAAETIADFPDARFIHVVRDSVAGLGDFRRRHPAFDAGTFRDRWLLVNGAALTAAHRWPGAVLLLRYEALRDEREAQMRRILSHMDAAFDPVTLTPSWNGIPLLQDDLGPFGGVSSTTAMDDDDVRWQVSPADQNMLQQATKGILVEIDQLAC